MFGIDISNWQKGLDLTTFDFDFAIIKATEGVGYISPSFVDQLTAVRNFGKLIGVYHFARPDLNSTETLIRAEARHFYEVMRAHDLIEKAIPVLDWEPVERNWDYLAEFFMDEFTKQSGVRPMIYASESLFKQSVPIKELAEKYDIWMAKWVYSGTILADEAKIESSSLDSKSGIPWTIWQFTANGRVDGYNGMIDFDYCNCSKHGWEWLCLKESTKLEKIKGGEVLTQEMKWAVQNSLFYPLSDGNYNPQMQITREELADTLWRYTEMLCDILKKTTLK